MFQSPHVSLNLETRIEGSLLNNKRISKPDSSFFSDRVDKKKPDFREPLLVLPIHEQLPSKEEIQELQAQQWQEERC